MSTSDRPIVTPPKPDLKTSPILEQIEPEIFECVWNGQVYSHGAFICRDDGSLNKIQYECIRGAWVRMGICS